MIKEHAGPRLPSLVPLAGLIILLMTSPLAVANDASAVREAQTLLTELSYSPGPIDGILGPRTLAALRNFQRTNGLEPTANIDLKTLGLLRAVRAKADIRSRPVPPVIPLGSWPANRTSKSAASSRDETPWIISDSGLSGTVDLSAHQSVSGSTGTILPFFLAVATAVFTLGLLGVFAGICSVAQGALPRLTRQVHVCAARQLCALWALVRKHPVWHWLNRSVAGQVVTRFIRSITPPKVLDPVKQWLGLFFRGSGTEPHLKRTAEPRGGQPDLFTPEKPRSRNAHKATDSDFLLNAPGLALRRGPHRLNTVCEVPLAAGGPTSMSSRRAASLPTSLPFAHALPKYDEQTARPGRPSGAPAQDGPRVADPNGNASARALLEASQQNTPKDALRARRTALQGRTSISDPLAAFSVHLACERYDEAEELAKRAVELYPKRHEYRLRLLQVYHETRNRIGFEYHAKALCAAVGADSPMMTIVGEWWSHLAPNEALFSRLDSKTPPPGTIVSEEHQASPEARDNEGSRDSAE